MYVGRGHQMEINKQTEDHYRGIVIFVERFSAKYLNHSLRDETGL